MESTERAISSAERLEVPLNTMCSMKCERPFCSGASQREPFPTQMPTETERTCGMVSLITRTPFGIVVVSISRTLVGVFCMSGTGGVPHSFVPFLGHLPPPERAVLD